jgi:hypothetical protein
MRRRAILSRRAVGGKRGPAPPRTTRSRAPRGLAAAPFFAPFLPPAQAKVVLLMAKHGPIGGTGITGALHIHANPANQLGMAMVKRGLATTAISTRGKGGERWYAPTAAGALLGSYLASVCTRIPAPRRARTPPPFPHAEPRPWRACAAVPGTPQSMVLGILDALVAGPVRLHALGPPMGIKTHQTARHLDRLVRAGIVRATFPGNVPTYAFDTRTKQGRAAFALFSTP